MHASRLFLTASIFLAALFPAAFLTEAFLPAASGAGPEFSARSELPHPGNPERGFQKNETSLGFALGGGLGTRVLGSEERHHLVEGLVRAGWVFSEVWAPGHWYSGNWELLGELFGGVQVHPRYRYFAGFTPLLRYTFDARPWAPFLNAGAGVSATDIQGPDLSKVFQFNLQAGGGVHYFLREKTALTLEYRWLHFSNAGITEVNFGTNTQMLLLGLSWFY
jgi:hypothetical protein